LHFQLGYPESVSLPTQDRFTVEGNHLVVQVKNTTTVRYAKRNGGHKPDNQFSVFVVTYTKSVFLTAEEHVRAR
jgi:hypothetical protein